MITKFTARGFKTLVDVEIELGLVNVFIGANGSGKSNVLEALGVLAAAAYGRVDEESLVRRGVRPKGYFRPLFTEIPKNVEISLAAENKIVSYTTLLAGPRKNQVGWSFKQECWKAGEEVLLDRSKDGAPKGDPEVGLAALRLSELNPSDPAPTFLKGLAGHNIYTPDTPVLRGWIRDPQIRDPIGLSGGRLASAVSNLNGRKSTRLKIHNLLSAVEWFKDFEVEESAESSEPAHELAFLDKFFRQAAGYVLEPDDVNEGVLYLLFVAVLCLHPKAPNLLSIDNADHSLNPLLARKLMETISGWLLGNANQRQILLTTHSPLTLDGLPLQDDRVRLFTVDRDNLGHTQVRRLVITDKHRDMAAKGWTLSRMWVNKLLGGVPDV